MLAQIGGKPLIVHTYESVAKSKVSDIMVATDDDRIANVLAEHNIPHCMTAISHKNGTSRCAEVISRMAELPDYVINVQGDEPFIHAEQINQLIELITKSNGDVCTLMTRFTEKDELANPNAVKVVASKAGKALYFSRSAIPYQRNEGSHFFKHIGLYGYKSTILPYLIGFPEGELESQESLEQLRWLENDIDIYIAESNYESQAVDTEEDLEKVIFNYEQGQ